MPTYIFESITIYSLVCPIQNIFISEFFKHLIVFTKFFGDADVLAQ